MKDECCPQFDPIPWNETTLAWEGKRFVKDRVTSFLHIPMNFGGVMKRNMKAIDALQAEPATQVVLSDENSLWGADVYTDGPIDRRTTPHIVRHSSLHAPTPVRPSSGLWQ